MRFTVEAFFAQNADAEGDPRVSYDRCRALIETDLDKILWRDYLRQYKDVLKLCCISIKIRGNSFEWVTAAGATITLRRNMVEQTCSHPTFLPINRIVGAEGEVVSKGNVEVPYLELGPLNHPYYMYFWGENRFEDFEATKDLLLGVSRDDLIFHPDDP